MSWIILTSKFIILNINFNILQKGGYNIVINKIVSSKYDYNKEIEFEELLIKDYPFYKGIDSKWTL